MSFEGRLENWGRAIRGNCTPARAKSPTYGVMLSLRAKFGAAQDSWSPTPPKQESVDWEDADKLSSSFASGRLALWDRNVLSMRYGYGISDKSLSRRFHVGEAWMRKRRLAAERNFQRIVEEFDEDSR